MIQTPMKLSSKHRGTMVPQLERLEVETLTGRDSLAGRQPQANRELERRVVNYLHGRHVPGLRQLSVAADNGVVTLRGRVHSFYEKQLAQSCCQRVAGVVRLIADVEVA